MTDYLPNGDAVAQISDVALLLVVGWASLVSSLNSEGPGSGSLPYAQEKN